MSDSAQVLVAIDCAPEDAEERAARAIEWLTSQGIVAPELTNCVLGEAAGYPPGLNFAGALDRPESGDVEGTRQLWTNGLAPLIGRRVFDTGENGIKLTCPSCITDFEPSADWADAVQAWFEGDDGAVYACRVCGFEQLLREWSGPRQWGFGHLALEFWNWPPLGDAFISQLRRVLGGRLQVVHCHR